MTYHVSLDLPFVHIRHDRSFSESAVLAARPAPPAPVSEMSWLSGLSDARAFDGIHRPWWRWLLPGLVTLVRTWRQRSRMRRELAQIDAHTLRDAGIDPGAANFEAALPFWRAPTRLRDSRAD